MEPIKGGNEPIIPWIGHNRTKCRAWGWLKEDWGSDSPNRSLVSFGSQICPWLWCQGVSTPCEALSIFGITTSVVGRIPYTSQNTR